ncbi:MAG: dTDP-4-dehydrorhamnose 3,5-epimerase family protein [Fidelibacterota bacterium]
MKIVKNLFNAVTCIEMPRFEDPRGSFTKNFADKLFRELGISLKIREMYYSVSGKNVIRGMHFQNPPAEHAKYVHVLNGAVRDVVLDLRKDSATYGSSADIILSAENHRSLFIPAGFAHGFLSLQDHTIMQYSVSSEHSPAHDDGILWNSFSYEWGIDDPVLSERDKKLRKFSEFKSPF